MSLSEAMVRLLLHDVGRSLTHRLHWRPMASRRQVVKWEGQGVLRGLPSSAKFKPACTEFGTRVKA